MSINTFPLILQSAEMITPNVRHLAFMKEDEQPLDFIPGQFITIHIDSPERSVKRSYSIASIPGRDNAIEIAASYVQGGIGSELLFNLQAGQKVTASGPFGRLVLRDERPERLILIATGTGVTPYRAMLPELERRFAESNLQVHLLLGVQSRNELLYGKDFIQFSARLPQHFIFHSFYSRVFPIDSFAYEHKGYVQEGFAKLQLNPKTDIVYLCGNPNMIDQAFNYLKELGFDQQLVRREKYISAK